MTRHRWTPDWDANLRQLYPDMVTREVAEVMGLPISAVKNRAQRLGLKKSEAFHQLKPGVFRPGHDTWNRGKKGVTGVQEACRRTQFKGGIRGQAAYNYRRIGSLRIAYGVLQRKVADDPGLKGCRKWQPVHRLLWEAANGPVPEGHVVVFKPGLHTTVEHEITLDRIECITRAENMRRNSYHTRLPPEVAQLVQLRGALNRKINNRLRKQHEEQGQ